MKRICKKCKSEKILEEFVKDNRVKLGYTYTCLECSKEYKQTHEQQNSEYYKQLRRNNYIKDRELRKEKSKIYYHEIHIKNIKKVEEHNLYKKQWREENPNYNREYRAKNKEERKAKNNEYEKQRRSRDPALRVSTSISSNIRISLKGNKSGRHWETLVGYTKNQLVLHLQQLFSGNMSWSNFGRGYDKWNIDHKIPLKFKNFDNTYYWNQEDLANTSSETFKRAWSLDNLQPKWSQDNILKGARYRD